MAAMHSTIYSVNSPTRRASAAMYNNPMALGFQQGNVGHYGYPPSPSARSFYDAGNVDLSALTHALGGVSVQGSGAIHSTGMAAPSQVSLVQAQVNGVPQYLLMPNGGAVNNHANGYGQQAMSATQANSDLSYGAYGQNGNHQSRYLGNAAFPYPGYLPLPMTPQGRGSAAHSELYAVDVPGLVDRKSSQGSNNDHEHSASPDTPHIGPAAFADGGVVIARADGSPRVSVFGTPSPQQSHGIYDQPLMLNSGPVHTSHGGKFPMPAVLPEIPPPVTIMSKNPVARKTLQESLYNPTGTTNVYIRGLHPETDDNTLLAYTSRFGRVMNSKSMIDMATGTCKGFGFAAFFTIQEAQACIRGFYYLGYESSFARESTGDQLKARADPTNTNLYVANLPRSMTEAELKAIFTGFTVESCRILRHDDGNSRGVGFARFASRADCDEVIKKFNGQLIGQERMPLQLRYSDTPEQKQLKQDKQKRREYMANNFQDALTRAGQQGWQRPVLTPPGFANVPLAPAQHHGNGLWNGYRLPSASVKIEAPAHNVEPAAKLDRGHTDGGNTVAEYASPVDDHLSPLKCTSRSIEDLWGYNSFAELLSTYRRQAESLTTTSDEGISTLKANDTAVKDLACKVKREEQPGVQA